MPSKRYALLLVSALLATACSGGSDKAEPSPTPSPTPTATPTPTPAVTDPLTGLPGRSTGSLVGIKIDNAPLARRYHKGIGQAAVVYQELVEGGLTRLLAVYESDRAGDTEVGPIRSFRASDVELVRMFGPIPVGFSGANGGVKSIVRRAASKKQLLDASYDAIPSAYRLGERRPDARNFYAVPATLASRRPGSAPTDIGLRFGDPAPSGVASPLVSAVFSPQSRVSFRYVPATKRWTVLQGGQPVRGAAPANVIVQRVKVRSSGFSDVRGMRTPFTSTIGGGVATLLRDGNRYPGTWKRAGFGDTRYLGPTGKDMRLRPGPTWVVLLPQSGSISFG